MQRLKKQNAEMKDFPMEKKKVFDPNSAQFLEAFQFVLWWYSPKET